MTSSEPPAELPESDPLLPRPGKTTRAKVAVQVKEAKQFKMKVLKIEIMSFLGTHAPVTMKEIHVWY